MIDEKLPPLTETGPGIYRHYKNLTYEVLGTVRHSETLEPMTLYRALYGRTRPVGATGGHVQRGGGDRRRAAAALCLDFRVNSGGSVTARRKLLHIL